MLLAYYAMANDYNFDNGIRGGKVEIADKNKKKVWITLLSIIIIITLGFGGYLTYSSYKLEKLTKMSSDEMIEYTTNGMKDAVITVGIINNGETSYKVYGENGTVVAIPSMNSWSCPKKTIIQL